MKIRLKLSYLILLVITIIGLATSCVPLRDLNYFNDIDEMTEPIVNPPSKKLIMPYDRLYIRVFSIDEKTSQLFNTNNNMSFGASNGMIGYLVDEEGNIDFPFTGKINVAGLGLSEAGAKIEEALNLYVLNATVNVKFVDNTVTVMGEVQRQGAYSFSQQKLNLYEALALAGGLTDYGNRKKVILIRLEGDKIMHYKLDLSDSRIAAKDYYYIQNNDVIVVEPTKFKSMNFGNNTYSLVLNSISTIITIVLFIQVL